MHKMNLFVFFLSLSVYPQKYDLKWAEEFEGPQINTEIWNFEKGFAKNHEQQFYTSENKNARIENGMLIIEAHKEQYQKGDYTSARLNTLNKKHFKYGRIEVRAKLPEGNGTWPAIWMLGKNHLTKGYPACGEVDIMEHVGKTPGEINSSVHYPETDNIKVNAATQSFNLPDSEDGFYTYAIEWDKSRITYFIDDIETFTYNLDEANRKGRKNIFRKPFYLILNLALGGKWAGEIDDAIFPTRFYVDYVRYYQPKD